MVGSSEIVKAVEMGAGVWQFAAAGCMEPQFYRRNIYYFCKNFKKTRIYLFSVFLNHFSL